MFLIALDATRIVQNSLKRKILKGHIFNIMRKA